MGQTMSDTPEAAPKQSLGKRVRFGDEPSLATSDEGAATNALATLAEAAAVESTAEADCSGAGCSGTAGEPAAGGASKQQRLDPRTQTVEQLLIELQLRYEATWRSLSGCSLMAMAVKQWPMVAL